MLTIKNCFEEFCHAAEEKRIIAFGASDFLRLISLNYRELKLGRYIDCVADNDRGKQGDAIEVDGSLKNIVPPDRILEQEAGKTAILISSDVYAYDIYTQLQEILQGRDMDVFVLPLMISSHVDDVTDMHMLSAGEGQRSRIPRMIHYFWFSGEAKTGLALECIESWKRACPDYEMKEWNADNYDVTANAFAYEAYKQKKWAYVSDYARLDTVYKHGGIYLDLDVVLFKSMDALLRHDFFIGFGPIRDVEAAAFGAGKGNQVVKEMLGIYENRSFELVTGMTLPNLQPMLLARFFEEKGFVINGRYQEKDGMVIYPRDVFSAKNWFTGEYELTDAAIGVHECAGGWDGKSSRKVKMEGIKKLAELYKKQH